MPLFFKKLLIVPRVLSLKEKIIVTALVLILLLALGNLFSLYSRIALSIRKPYREGIVGSYSSLNPFSLQLTNDADAALYKLIFSSLTRADSSKEKTLSYDLLDTYRVENNLLYLTIKQTWWSDDMPLTADDVLFTIETIKKTQIKNPFKLFLEKIEVTKIGTSTIAIASMLPPENILPNLTFPIAPKHIYENRSSSSEKIMKTTSGIFRIDDITNTNGKPKKIILVPSKNYYGKKTTVKALEFIFFETITDAIDAYTRKKIDGLSLSSLTPLPDRFQENNHAVLQIPYYTALFFNFSSQSPWRERSLRSALNTALDRASLLKQKSDIQIIVSPILPQSKFYNASLQQEYNATRTIDVLTTNNYQKNNLWLEKNGKRLELTITYPFNPQLETLARFLKEQWEQIGISIILNPISQEEIQNSVIPQKKFESLLYGILETGPDDPNLFLWHSSRNKNLNFFEFSSTSTDALIEKLEFISDEQLRAKRFDDFQKTIAEELPAIFLFQAPLYYFYPKTLNGFDVSSITIPADRFNTITQWRY
ncbi:MAG: hypothetical protein HYW78_00815 [Parcubacteria group bacterium]|nr:hypothetical protein [Parcubacteria group bacterium]